MDKKQKDSTPYGTFANVIRWSKDRGNIRDLYPSESYFFTKNLKFCHSFLDIGCATGNFLNIIKKKTKIKKYTGMDVSPNMISKAKELYPKFTFKIYNGKTIKDNYNYDLVYSFGTLQYCNNYKKLITQMINLSKRFTIFDLRFSFEKNFINIYKNYQIIPNSNNARLPYNVINFFEFLRFILDITKKKFKVSFYGYKKTPAKNIATEAREVFMVSVMIDKNNRFKLDIDIN